jgi:hypothetical protein
MLLLASEGWAQDSKLGSDPHAIAATKHLRVGESIIVLITLRRDGFSSRRSVMSTLGTPTLID